MTNFVRTVTYFVLIFATPWCLAAEDHGNWVANPIQAVNRPRPKSELTAKLHTMITWMQAGLKDGRLKDVNGKLDSYLNALRTAHHMVSTSDIAEIALNHPQFKDRWQSLLIQSRDIEASLRAQPKNRIRDKVLENTLSLMGSVQQIMPADDFVALESEHFQRIQQMQVLLSSAKFALLKRNRQPVMELGRLLGELKPRIQFNGNQVSYHYSRTALRVALEKLNQAYRGEWIPMENMYLNHNLGVLRTRLGGVLGVSDAVNR